MDQRDDITVSYLQRRQAVRIETNPEQLAESIAPALQRLQQFETDPLGAVLGRPPTDTERAQFESLLRGRERERIRARSEAEQAQPQEALPPGASTGAAPDPLRSTSEAARNAEAIEAERQRLFGGPLMRVLHTVLSQDPEGTDLLQTVQRSIATGGRPAGPGEAVEQLLTAAQAIFGPGINLAMHAARKAAERLGAPPAVQEAAALLSAMLVPSPYFGAVVGRAATRELSQSQAIQRLAAHATATENLDAFKRFLKQGQWAAISAEKSHLSAPENAARTADLLAELLRRGYHPLPSSSRYGGAAERAFFVPGMSTDDALELGRKFQQESVLTREGLVFVGTGKVHPIDIDRTNFDAALADNFTEVVIGGQPTRFQVPVDFERGLLRLERYTQSPPPKVFDPADPASRAGLVKGEEQRLGADAPPSLHYYISETVPEARVGGARFKSIVHVPEERIYDLGTDPLGLKKQAGADAAQLRRLIRDAGYMGFMNSALENPTMRRVVALFEPAKVVATQDKVEAINELIENASRVPIAARILATALPAAGAAAEAAQEPGAAGAAEAGVGGLPLTFNIDWSTFRPRSKTGNALAALLAARVAAQRLVLGGTKEDALEWLSKVFGPESALHFDALWARARELYESELRAFRFNELDKVMRFHAEGRAFPDWYGAGNELVAVVGPENADTAAKVIAALSSHTPVDRMNENFAKVWMAYTFGELPLQNRDAMRAVLQTDDRVLARLREVAPDTLRALKEIGGDTIPSTQYPNVLRALLGMELHGNKVWSFAHNLRGRRYIDGRPVVTVDGQTAEIMFGDVPRKPSGELHITDAQYALAQEGMVWLSRLISDPDPVYTQQATWVGRQIVTGRVTPEAVQTEWQSLRRAMDRLGISTFLDRARREGLSETGFMTVAAGLVIGDAVLRGYSQANTREEQGALIAGTIAAAGLPLDPRMWKRIWKVLRDEAGTLRRAAGRSPAAVIRPASLQEADYSLQRIWHSIPRGDKEVNINWSVLREPGALDEVFQALVDLRPVEKTVQPDAVTAELARELGLTPEVFLRRNPTDTFSAAEALAAKELLVAGRRRMLDLAQRLSDATGTPDEARLAAEFDYHFGVMALMYERFLNIASEMGRAFRVLREVPGDLLSDLGARLAKKDLSPEERTRLVRDLRRLGETPVAEMFDVGELMRRLRQPRLDEQLAFGFAGPEPQMLPFREGLPSDVRQDFSTFLSTLSEKEQPHFLRRVFSSQTFDEIYEAWVNTLLLTFQGNQANFLSNAAMLAREIANVQAAGVLGLFRQGPDKVHLGEGTAMVAGVLHGFMDALLSGGRIGAVARATAGGAVGAGAAAAQGGDMGDVVAGGFAGAAAGAGLSALPQLRNLPRLAAGGPEKDLARAAIAARNRGLDPNSILGWAVDLLGEVVRFPGSTIRATDEFFKVIDKRAIQWREAYRTAVTSPDKSLRDIRELVQEYMLGMNPRVNALADEFANYATFTQELGTYTSPLGEVVQHPLLRFVVPFFRTPVNIMKAEFDQLPFLNRLATQTRAELASASAAVQDVARARLALGALTAATIGYLAWNGLITDDGPSDPNLKREWLDAGNVPNAVKVGGQWVSLDRIDPLGMHLGLVAKFVRLTQEWVVDDDESLLHEFDELGAALVLAFANNVASKTWLRGFSDFLQLVTAKRPEDLDDRNFFTNLLASPVAPAARQIRKVVDPYEREVRSWLDNIANRIPGVSDKLPPRLNLKGEPVQFGSGQWWEALVPARIAKDPNDPVRKAILDNKVALTLPGRYIAGPQPPAFGPERPGYHGIELTPEQAYWYGRLAGNDLKLPAADVKVLLRDFAIPDFELRGKPAYGMWDTLEALVQSPVFKQATTGPDGMQAYLIKGVVQGFRKAARGVLLATQEERQQTNAVLPRDLPVFPDLINRYLLKYVEKAGALGGPEARGAAAEQVERARPGLFGLSK